MVLWTLLMEVCDRGPPNNNYCLSNYVHYANNFSEHFVALKIAFQYPTSVQLHLPLGPISIVVVIMHNKTASTVTTIKAFGIAIPMCVQTWLWSVAHSTLM